MALIQGNLDLLDFMFATPKRHIGYLRETACFGVFCIKIRPAALAVASCKNRKKRKNGKKKPSKHFWCAKSRMRRNETLGRITGVGVHDVITSANFYD